jgi:hypothetical protein
MKGCFYFLLIIVLTILFILSILVLIGLGAQVHSNGVLP